MQVGDRESEWIQVVKVVEMKRAFAALVCNNARGAKEVCIAFAGESCLVVSLEIMQDARARMNWEHMLFATAMLQSLHATVRGKRLLALHAIQESVEVEHHVGWLVGKNENERVLLQILKVSAVFAFSLKRQPCKSG